MQIFHILSLYKALVRLHLKYATEVYMVTYLKDKIAAEKSQRMTSKIVKESGKSYLEKLKC